MDLVSEKENESVKVYFNFALKGDRIRLYPQQWKISSED